MDPVTIVPPSGSAGPADGLTADEAATRLREVGPNRLADAPRRSPLRVFLDQFRNLLVVVLLVAAVLAGAVGELKDTIVIGVVLLLNAVLGFVQEHRAERSLDALRSMLVPVARVRRGGRVVEVAAEEVVPGDLVLLEAGDRVPADGRLAATHGAEFDESTLTGESTPVRKQVGGAVDEGPLGERVGAVFMNTVVTRGRAEVEVTATGMQTEIGRIAGMLATAGTGTTPLQDQLHGLGKRLAGVAGVAVSLFLALELLRGRDLAETLLSAVALAVAAIPEGLPAVVTVTLAVGTFQMAKRGAIVKRLASVETLGATTVICSDKTGTLTLNQMTATALVVDGTRHAVTGTGYSPDGAIEPTPSADGPAADALVVAALCNDSTVRDGQLIGDPTEGALMTLALKSGLDLDELRARLPRVAEVPFDPAVKLMATFHLDDPDRDAASPDAGAGTLLLVKGATDVLLARSRADAPERDRWTAAMEELASTGLRVLALARRQLDVDPRVHLDAGGDPLAFVEDLELLGLVGIVDPARDGARDAIATCRRAGIAFTMITGDHAVTAAAIARDLGIHGEVLTGADLDTLDDDALSARIEGIGVVARVAPEHKVRMVRVLQQRGHVVAMTGDGVNDAPALKTADIGVAMGITGTEVTKEAAAMVLTDDDVATIVGAVEQGRTIYQNIVTFVRFQLATNVGAILTMLSAPIVGLPVPFTAIQILWVNLIMDGPPAMALGIDPPTRGIMEQPPRDRHTGILTVRRLGMLISSGVVMAVGTLSLLAVELGRGTREHALAMAFTTFVVFQLFNALNARAERATVFRRETLRNGKLWTALAGVLTLQVLAVHLEPVQQIFGTADLAPGDWLLVVVVASSVLWVEEVRKLVVRRRGR